MEVLLVIAIGIGIWWWWTSNSKKSKAGQPRAPLPEPAIRVTVETSRSFSPRETPLVDVGVLTAVGPNAWVLNPASPLPLTLQGTEKGVAETVKDLLGRQERWQQKVPSLALLIARHNLSFKEIDDFVAQLKPKFDAEVSRRIRESTEWSSASELDRADLRTEFEEAALEGLGVSVGHADLQLLLAGPPAKLETDDEILGGFGGDAELYAFYLSQLGRSASVVNVKADEWGRKNWERLAEKGYALRGKDIPVQLLLEGLRLKDLNELLAGTIEKPLGRKAKALEAVLALPDLQERLSRQISFREVFQAVPPADIDVSALLASFGWANEVAGLAQRTYFTGVQTLEAIQERNQEKGIYNAWEIRNWDDPLPECARPYCKQYARLPAKRPPFHVGCDCQLENSFKD